jgi:hypothetical protein
MRMLLFAALWLFACSEAGAQSCSTGCGCQPGKHGSGWRRIDTKSKRCVGCDEMHLCGKERVGCHWEGCRSLTLIRQHCPQYIPAVPCPLK